MTKINIRLIPLEKIIVDEKEIRLGEKKEAVISMLGAPEHIHENYGGGSWRHYYSEEKEYWTTIGIGVKGYYTEA